MRAMAGCEGKSSPPPRSRGEADRRPMLPSVAIDIFGRNPGVAVAIASQVTDPGKRQMWRGDKGALLCEKVERLPAHGARLIRDDVIDDGHPGARKLDGAHMRSEEHTSELQSLMRISYAVFCLKKKITRARKQ